MDSVGLMGRFGELFQGEERYRYAHPGFLACYPLSSSTLSCHTKRGDFVSVPIRTTTTYLNSSGCPKIVHANVKPVSRERVRIAPRKKPTHSPRTITCTEEAMQVGRVERVNEKPLLVSLAIV